MPALGGRAEQLLLVGLSPIPAEKGTLLPSRYQPLPSNPLGNSIAQKLSHLTQMCFLPSAAWLLWQGSAEGLGIRIFPILAACRGCN